MPYKVGDVEVFGLGERDSGFKLRSNGGFQDFQKIQAKCLKNKIKFEDDDFSANESSLGNVKIDGGPFSWKRPSEICQAKKIRKPPKFIVGGADRFDVRQGDLGDCWLLAAIADLTLNQDNFKMVVPEDNTFGKEYTGAFHFRFWQFGKWIDIVVDDRLLCRADGDLVFMNSESENEFWSPLLEKAYAKLNGSYKALDGGLTFQALEDFTGGFTEVFMMSRLKSLNLIDGPDEFFELLKSSFDKSSFMGSSVKVNQNVKEAELPNGLICGHAYSITDLRLVNVNIDGQRGQVRLLRLRNPWGSDAEWKGEWCDRDQLWDSISPQEKTDLQLTFAADGEFWLSYEDFMDNFQRVEVCHQSPRSKFELLDEKQTKHKWVSHSMNGNWTPGATAGGSLSFIDTFANNPQYVLNIGEPGVRDNIMIVCLLKKERLAEPDTSDVKDVAMNIFKIQDGLPKPLTSDFFSDPSNKPLKQLTPLKGLREITIRFMVPSGLYVIVPSSIKPNQEGEFLLRVFTESFSTLELYDDEVDVQEKDVEVTDDTLDEIALAKKAHDFFKVVAGEHEEVNWWDLKLILDKSFHDEFRFEGFGFSEDVCRSMVALLDTDRSGQLSLYEFTDLWSQVVMWKKMFNQFDANQSNTLGTLKTNELREALRAGGFKVNKDILEALVLRYGDKNGEVSLDKFIIAALKLKTMIELYKRFEVKGQPYAQVTLCDWLDLSLYS